MSDKKIMELCYTQMPNGSTLLHMMIHNEFFIYDLFERMKEASLNKS